MTGLNTETSPELRDKVINYFEKFYDTGFILYVNEHHGGEDGISRISKRN